MIEIKNAECFFPMINKEEFEFEEDYLKSITVCFDIKGNGVFMPEFQRYNKWANTGIIMSQSTMHAMEKFMNSNFDPYTKYVLPEIKEIAKKNYKAWAEAKKTEDKQKIYETFETLVHNLPRGFELWATVNSNFLQLKTIVIQRFHHRNKEDWGAFVEFCYSLPKFRELCGFTSEEWNIENW